MAVWSRDPAFDANVVALKHVADHVEALRRFETDGDPALARCAEQARNDYESQATCRVPVRLTGGRDVWCGPIFVDARRLPGALLAVRWLPVFVTEGSKHVAVVPAAQWGRAYREAWSTAVAARRDGDWAPYSVEAQRSTWTRRHALGAADGASVAAGRSALEELDFPRAAALLLPAALEDREDARALLVKVVDRSATPAGLFTEDETGELGWALEAARAGEPRTAQTILEASPLRDRPWFPSWQRFVEEAPRHQPETS